MASRIKKKGWVFLFVVTGIIDLVQLLCDLFLSEFFGIPEIVFAIAEPIIGILLVGYLQLRGVNMINHPKRLASILGFAGLEELTGGIAPAWIVDVWYIYRDVKKEEAAEKARAEEEMWLNQATATSNTLYKDGMRMPNQTQTTNSGQTAVLNKNGVRRPENRNPNFQISSSAGTTTSTEKSTGSTKSLSSVKV